MREEDIRKSLDEVKPSHMTEQRMLNKVLNHTEEKKWARFIMLFNKRRVIPVLTMCFVILGSIMAYRTMGNKDIRDNIGTDRIRTFDVAIAEDSIAQVKNQFQIENKHYIILPEEQKKEFGFKAKIIPNDIGDKITTITTSVDNDLMGSEVYKYIPAGSDAIVALKKDNEYSLFRFMNFDSYMNNQDEDVKAYLELYGINNASDMEKIQFINRSEEAKLQGKLDIVSEITDKEKVNQFYNYYSVIRNSSDKYFDKLFNYKAPDNSKEQTYENRDEPKEVPPDYIEGAVADLPSNQVKVDKGYIASDLPASTSWDTGNGVNALTNQVTIRIYNKNGVYFDAEYYPNISFISRHEVNEDFKRFLKEYIE